MKKQKMIIIALIVMLLWGSLFPCVKLAYTAFQMDSQSPANLLLFAGTRFVICGGCISLYCAIRGKNIKSCTKVQWLTIVIVGLLAVVLHYSCTYIGLAKTDSSKTAILKQLAAMIFIAFSFIFFKEDKFSIGKLLGAFLGLCGVVALNFNSSTIVFGVGEILIIIASFCTVASNVVMKKLGGNIDVVTLTGYSQLIGGGILFAIGLFSGGNIGEISWGGVGIFTYICIASIVSYCLWYGTVKNSHLSTLFIIKFTEPLFACLFGAILLGENIFKWQYLIALGLVVVGICVGSLTEKEKSSLNRKKEREGIPKK